MAWTPYLAVRSQGQDPADALNEINATLRDMLVLQAQTLNDMAVQLRLLNERFEEAFETDIDEGDM